MSEIKLPADSAEEIGRVVESLVNGTRRFHDLPKTLSHRDQTLVRRLALERMQATKLEHTGSFTYDVDAAVQANCENIIGVAQIPVGVVGPLPIVGDHVDESLYVPLATTEGALVASTNRGCAALRAAGPVRVRVEDVGMTRAPVFRTTGIQQTTEFLAWIREHEDELRSMVESTSRFLRLVEIKPYVIGTTVFLRFRFRCGDAMGMNMATIACDRMVRQIIQPGTGVPCIALSGNYCVDKKPAGVNWQEGRGKRIFAEVVLSKEVLRDNLKTTAAAIAEVAYRKNYLGSVAAQAMGYNAHFANVISAFFIATGQDVAHVVEGSLGVTCIEEREDGEAYFSVYLPDCPVGAVGGGTSLGTQSECLGLLGVDADPEKPGEAVMRLAEILGATVLAGELSLMAAFTSNDLASAHERLGRGKKGPPPLGDAAAQD